MIKKLLSIALSALICFNSVAHADWKQSITTGWWKGNFGKSVILENLKQYQGLVFFKDTRRGTVTFADRALGSSVGVYTSTRSASNPATWIDSTGRINVSTTSNVPLKNYGYYDSVGFHPKELGYSAFRSSTNLLTRTDGTAYSGGLWTGWTVGGTVTGTIIKTNTGSTSLINIVGTTSQRMQYVALAGDSGTNISINSPNTAVGSVSQNDVLTISFYVRSLTGNTKQPEAYIVPRNSSGTALGAYTNNIVAGASWTKSSFSATITDATVSMVSLKFGRPSNTAFNVDDNIDLEIAGVQIEKLPYATPFIPTTTTALTRNADVLKWETAGNRNAAEETIVVKFTPGSTFANDSIFRMLTDSETKNRLIYKSATLTEITTTPNYSDNLAVNTMTTTSPLINTSYVSASVIKHSSPYIQVYINGTSEETYTDGDFTNPAWGTYFYIGSSNDGSFQFDGFIPFIAVWNRALSAAEIKEISQILTYN